MGQMSGQTSSFSLTVGTKAKPAAEVDSHFSGALGELLKACEYAESCRQDRWEFSIRIKSLCRLGLSESDLRLLVSKGIIEHARECSTKNGKTRSFKFGGSLRFNKRTCFVLTTTGQKFAFDYLNLPPQGSTEKLADLLSAPRQRLVPRWDNGRHTIFVDSYLVKRFRWPACNQEAVLNALEEEQWPASGVFDPLAPTKDKDPKQRLRDTTKCLNRHQEHPFVRFRGDGTGERIVWEFTAEAHEVLGLQSTMPVATETENQRAG
jgi:hypothetical protein